MKYPTSRTIRFDEGPHGGVASTVLCALLSTIGRAEGQVLNEAISAAEEIARQVSKEWVSCVAGHVAKARERTKT